MDRTRGEREVGWHQVAEIDSVPNISGDEVRIEATIVEARGRPVFFGGCGTPFAGVTSAFAIALHMHQPLIPGRGFIQWTGSVAQQQALTRLDELSQAVHTARENAIGTSSPDAQVYRLIEMAHQHVLRRDQLQLLLGRGLDAALPRRPQ